MATCNPPLYSSSNFWLDGGSTGGVTIQVYIDRAPALPDDPTIPALSYPAAGGSLQQWDVASQSWT